MGDNIFYDTVLGRYHAAGQHLEPHGGEGHGDQRHVLAEREEKVADEHQDEQHGDRDGLVDELVLPEGLHVGVAGVVGQEAGDVDGEAAVEDEGVDEARLEGRVEVGHVVGGARGLPEVPEVQQHGDVEAALRYEAGEVGRPEDGLLGAPRAVDLGGLGARERHEHEGVRERVDGGLDVAEVDAVDGEHGHADGGDERVQTHDLVEQHDVGERAAAAADEQGHAEDVVLAVGEGGRDAGLAELDFGQPLLHVALELLERLAVAQVGLLANHALQLLRDLAVLLLEGALEQRDADVGGLEGGHVVGAVAAHGSLHAGTLEGADHKLLLLRRDAGEDGGVQDDLAQDAAASVTLVVDQGVHGGAGDAETHGPRKEAHLLEEVAGAGMGGQGIAVAQTPEEAGAAPDEDGEVAPGAAERGGRDHGGPVPDLDGVGDVAGSEDVVAGDHDELVPLEVAHAEDRGGPDGRLQGEEADEVERGLDLGAVDGRHHGGGDGEFATGEGQHAHAGEGELLVEPVVVLGHLAKEVAQALGGALAEQHELTVEGVTEAEVGVRLRQGKLGKLSGRGVGGLLPVGGAAADGDDGGHAPELGDELPAAEDGDLKAGGRVAVGEEPGLLGLDDLVVGAEGPADVVEGSLLHGVADDVAGDAGERVAAADDEGSGDGGLVPVGAVRVRARAARHDADDLHLVLSERASLVEGAHAQLSGVGHAEGLGAVHALLVELHDGDGHGHGEDDRELGRDDGGDDVQHGEHELLEVRGGEPLEDEEARGEGEGEEDAEEAPALGGRGGDAVARADDGVDQPALVGLEAGAEDHADAALLRALDAGEPGAVRAAEHDGGPGEDGALPHLALGARDDAALRADGAAVDGGLELRDRLAGEDRLVDDDLAGEDEAVDGGDGGLGRGVVREQKEVAGVELEARDGVLADGERALQPRVSQSAILLGRQPAPCFERPEFHGVDVLHQLEHPLALVEDVLAVPVGVVRVELGALQRDQLGRDGPALVHALRRGGRGGDVDVGAFAAHVLSELVGALDEGAGLEEEDDAHARVPEAEEHGGRAEDTHDEEHDQEGVVARQRPQPGADGGEVDPGDLGSIFRIDVHVNIHVFIGPGAGYGVVNGLPVVRTGRRGDGEYGGAEAREWRVSAHIAMHATPVR
ncbi:uncharacterized protein BcabD6B2_44240 [Babesia caballi]|uniref:Uncharacterized protein n=1 Tax=Babesia caballi TaxID=5871 RepID=A0AAV4LY26_BABCB|nr:hypothetical protein BcabD6B2_44240 [Babesia caballi]